MVQEYQELCDCDCKDEQCAVNSDEKEGKVLTKTTQSRSRDAVTFEIPFARRHVLAFDS